MYCIEKIFHLNNVCLSGSKMKISYFTYFLFLVFFFFGIFSNTQAAEIQWKVENRFPLFIDARDFHNLELAFGTGSAVDFLAKNSSIINFRQILPIHRTAWQSDSRTYDSTILFRHEHIVRFSFVESPVSGQCTWQFNSETHSGTCDGITLPIVEGRPFFIALIKDGTQVATLNEKNGIQVKMILAVGDSFGSGEGNPDHPTLLKNPVHLNEKWFVKNSNLVVEKDALWWDKACHRSLLSWQALYAMRQAISDPHRVVRFASFSCSGAEIYDGFLNPQKNPPGTANLSFLSTSQQHAMISLLCQRGLVTVKKLSGSAAIQGPRKDQWIFGNYDFADCSESPIYADEILVSFGGNDVGFSGVVKWGIGVPDMHNHKNGLLSIIRTGGLGLINKFIDPVSPEHAATTLKYMPQLYKDLQDSLVKITTSSSRTIVLIYPDPLPVDDFQGCQDRTRDGNHPLAMKINNIFSDFKFGLPKKSAQEIREKFIDPLRSMQIKLISDPAIAWMGVDANDGLIISENNRRSICGNSATCKSGSCEPGNRLTWSSEKNYSKIPHLDSLLDFNAYDPSRVRGLRSASDALLTQAVRNNEKGLEDDWMTGIAHPTAAVHAAIADNLFNQLGK